MAEQNEYLDIITRNDGAVTIERAEKPFSELINKTWGLNSYVDKNEREAVRVQGAEGCPSLSRKTKREGAGSWALGRDL